MTKKEQNFFVKISTKIFKTIFDIAVLLNSISHSHFEFNYVIFYNPIFVNKQNRKPMCSVRGSTWSGFIRKKYEFVEDI